MAAISKVPLKKKCSKSKMPSALGDDQHSKYLDVQQNVSKTLRNAILARRLKKMSLTKYHYTL